MGIISGVLTVGKRANLHLCLAAGGAFSQRKPQHGNLAAILKTDRLTVLTIPEGGATGPAVFGSLQKIMEGGRSAGARDRTVGPVWCCLHFETRAQGRMVVTAVMG